MDAIKHTNANLLPALYKAGNNLPTVFAPGFKPSERVSGFLPAFVETRKLRSSFTAMGLVMPFYPCMWNKETTVAALNNAIYLVQAKMSGKFTSACIDSTISVLRSLFLQLDVNTHKQSLAIRWTAAGITVMYLNFPVRPVLIFGKSVSLLECAVNKPPEKDFYLLVFDIIHTSIYQYTRGHITRVIVRPAGNPPGPSGNMAMIFDLLDSRHITPVFITGIPQLAKNFYNKYGRDLFFYLPPATASFSAEVIRQLSEDIAAKWEDWHSKFLMGKIRVAHKTNHLVCGAGLVLHALKHLKDGILLLDKKLKHLLLGPARDNNIFPVRTDLLLQVDKFIERGNLVEVIHPGFLRDFGGILLLSENKAEDIAIRPWHAQASDGNTIY
jgi:hypothetical protein